jgi:integration host factor subunit alpha
LNVNKNYIASELAKKLDLNKSNSLDFLNLYLNIIKKNIANSDLKIHNFGTFKIKNSPKRVGRNPKTKEEYTIKARKRISFKASRNLIKILN